jgi:hypothetical protein
MLTGHRNVAAVAKAGRYDVGVGTRIDPGESARGTSDRARASRDAVLDREVNRMLRSANHVLGIGGWGRRCYADIAGC